MSLLGCCIISLNAIAAKASAITSDIQFNSISNSSNNFQISIAKKKYGNNCPQEITGYTFKTQKSIDDFKTNFSKCTVVPILHIEGGGITNIDAFNNIETVEEGITISSTNVEEISGFDNLTHVNENIYITNNKRLSKIDAFQNLETIGTSFDLRNNIALAEIYALPQLKSIGSYMVIADNSDAGRVAPINFVSKFAKLSSIPALQIVNSNLTHLSVFQHVTDVGKLFVVDDPLLTSLDGLQNITQFNDGTYSWGWFTDCAPSTTLLCITRNPVLEDCSQLKPLYQTNKDDDFILDLTDKCKTSIGMK